MCKGSILEWIGPIVHQVTDHLGSPVLAFDSQGGSKVWAGGFEPFGGDYSGAQNAGIFMRFPGQWNDSSWDATFGTESGVYYNVHRWYEYGTGRYTKVDPAGPMAGPEAGGAATSHPFAYGAVNPLSYIDPFALSPQDACCDCPEQLWSYRGVSGGIGLIWWGWERSEGRFTCLSNRDLKVEVNATCRLRGPQLFGGASFDFSFTKFFPGGRACNVEDLFEQTSTAPIGFQTIPIGAEGDPTNNTGLISVGIRPGAVVSPTKECQFRPYEPPF